MYVISYFLCCAHGPHDPRNCQNEQKRWHDASLSDPGHDFETVWHLSSVYGPLIGDKVEIQWWCLGLQHTLFWENWKAQIWRMKTVFCCYWFIIVDHRVILSGPLQSIFFPLLTITVSPDLIIRMTHPLGLINAFARSNLIRYCIVCVLHILISRYHAT